VWHLQIRLHGEADIKHIKYKKSRKKKKKHKTWVADSRQTAWKLLAFCAAGSCSSSFAISWCGGSTFGSLRFLPRGEDQALGTEMAQKHFTEWQQ